MFSVLVAIATGNELTGGQMDWRGGPTLDSRPANSLKSSEGERDNSESSARLWRNSGRLPKE